ncbi:MoxR family ATPase [Brevibacillus borstelensis]|jgi:MoxR-like ATPase|uniref:AAA family ATPase n=1 Tax=Brevibacillus borstelensis TaxID=45462 RepID=UPI000F080196|nr:MoxR family ATPase [Brevibacillus borstelensis]MCM3471507.1 MoxR family ATPase [Brevibacillus borstelensis]MCM3590587.1 MoxR family ATPase [Brevibacillus borstelensis]MCM3622387.1 MoxR family ATPase [Brevibacillus borstelensis]MED1852278.1 MoxR family ATPase [Brevibacillus borstelensis]MED1875704.1 MoxR family ATPase [Brevibacillus borstelensis]
MSGYDFALIERDFYQHGYVTDTSVATALRLVLCLGKPLLVEGPAGVGKTEIAKTLSRVLHTRLIRLQCYEGMDSQSALYEWNYQRQLIRIKLGEDSGRTAEEREEEIFGPAFLLKRPILEALTDENRAPVLLIDEIDRADESFEAFLLEALAEFQVTIPELGTIRAVHRPYVILTSNRTRELSDALRRRCLYQWLAYPDMQKEAEILRVRLPDISQRLAEQISLMMANLRALPLQKVPGVAESLDWAQALIKLHRSELDPSVVQATMGCFVKYRDDWETVEEQLRSGRLLVEKR